MTPLTKTHNQLNKARAGDSQAADRSGYWTTRKRVRGVTMLFFLITIPVLFAFAALSVDVGRLLEAHRSLVQATEEAAQSGATAYVVGGGTEPRIDPTTARAYALSNWNRAQSMGVVSAENAEISSIIATDTQVTVRARATVGDLIFLRYFQIINGDGTWEITATGEATVCLAGYGGETACTRPDA